MTDSERALIEFEALRRAGVFVAFEAFGVERVTRRGGLNHLTGATGAYAIFLAATGACLYVGYSADLRSRFRGHASLVKSRKTNAWSYAVDELRESPPEARLAMLTFIAGVVAPAPWYVQQDRAHKAESVLIQALGPIANCPATDNPYEVMRLRHAQGLDARMPEHTETPDGKCWRSYRTVPAPVAAAKEAA